MEEIEIHEPTRFAWTVDGELVAGTLKDWAKMWEHGYYAGESGLTGALITWDGTEDGAPKMHRVTVARRDLGEDDYIPHIITVSDSPDVVSVSIDGRN